MRMVTTTNFELCTRCGEPVARIKSERTGNLYSVRIDMDRVQNGSALVGVADFHNCDAEQMRAYRAAKAAEATKAAPATTAAPFAGIAKLFSRATNKGAKRITITLHADAHTTLELKYSSRRDVIYLSNGSGWGNLYYGAITMTGEFRNGRERLDAAREALLSRFESNPVAVAVESARISSQCSFCRLPLTDERSVAAGYGPICAEKYGLPWGENHAAA